MTGYFRRTRSSCCFFLELHLDASLGKQPRKAVSVEDRFSGTKGKTDTVKALLYSAIVIALAACGSSAFAESIDYTLTSGSDTITFSLPQPPTAAACAFYGGCATFNGVAVDVDGTVYADAQVNFYLASEDGGITIFTDPTEAQMLVDNDGNFAEQLFTGPVTDPTLVAPITSYVLNQESYGGPEYNEQFSLTAEATPEPSSILLLGTGLLGLAALAHRKIRA